MQEDGYYRFPTISGPQVVFVCEDDLWEVPAEGGIPRRLTAHLADTTHPFLSPDGQSLAFIAREEGPPEVYVMPAAGGPVRRVTFLASATQVIGWHPDGRILFTSDSAQPFRMSSALFAIDPRGGLPEELPYGSGCSLSFGRGGKIAVGRYTRDTARWKRYRGGLAGQIWVDARGNGRFRRLSELKGNLANPMWLGDRLYFIADHEGIGNLYSCTAEATDLRRHTDHEVYYARNATTDGKRIVYHVAGDLHIFDPARDEDCKVPVDFRSSWTQKNRKFIEPTSYFETYHPHPQGHSVAVAIRGKVMTASNWEGPVHSHGKPDGVRYRTPRWLNDGKRLVMHSDEGGEERLIVVHADGTQPERKLPAHDIGRVLDMSVSPKEDTVAVSTHRGILAVIDVKSGRHRVLEVSKHGRLRGISWSPDGLWIAYGFPDTGQSSIIKLCRVKDGKTFAVTRPVLFDSSPVFDPDGKYLYFLSHRVFDPVYDNMHFDLSFPRGMRPHLVILRQDLPSPFTPRPDHGDEGKTEDVKSTTKDAKASGSKSKTKAKDSKKDRLEPTRIDLEGIEDRVVAFPVEEGRYEQLAALPKGKVLFTTVPVQGSLSRDSDSIVPSARATLHHYDLGERRQDTWVDGVSWFRLSRDNKSLYYRVGRRLRVVPASDKPKAEEKGEGPGRRSGWIDFARFRISVIPALEWAQMLREAWRLQRDHYWVEHMCGIDWETIYERYARLVPRIGSRSEFSDLMWEMQGELGTSHAYEWGGEYRRSPYYRQGFLGADFSWDRKARGYRVEHLVRGDGWNPRGSSPLLAPGVDVRKGDVLRAIGGRPLDEWTTPQELLVNQAGRDVQLEVARGREKARRVTVQILSEETSLRYRDWVESNRAHVHERSGGRVGYLHIPDMGPNGYAEFHRYYLVENRFDGLVVDVRFNGGGNVSQLLLEKLVRRRIGYCVPRWGVPEPYPTDSVLGPMVAVTNERAGSDGDIFSHGFKLLKLGPLIGTRTWGGVIGIWPRHHLVDGTTTTQPEFSFWFHDVGWGVENYGTQPDVVVEMDPQSEVEGRDPQLDRAIELVMARIKELKPKVPKFSEHPVLLLPQLPPRPGRARPAKPAPTRRRR